MKKYSGFTLIELLVVISIIGILAALAMVSFTSSQRQARDSARKSDIKQYQNSLESYANQNNGLYPQRPDASGAFASTTLCSDIGQTNCPEDTKYATDPTYAYRYQSDGTLSDGTAVGTQYVLWSKLENVEFYWVICSNGKTGFVAFGSLVVNGGVCPI